MLLQEIFENRQILALRAQGSHKVDLLKLVEILKEANIPHPYCSEAITLVHDKEPYSNAEFRRPKGPLLAASALDKHTDVPEAAFLYRLHGVESVQWLPSLAKALNTAARVSRQIAG